MANAAAPFGLRPSHTVSGSAYNGQTRLYYIPSTDTIAYSVGDVVVERNPEIERSLRLGDRPQDFVCAGWVLDQEQALAPFY